MDDVAGIDAAAVTRWLDERVERSGDLRFELITGGRSNLTYRVADDSGVRWVLRRPPLGQVLATAHDMGREHRLIAALKHSDVPVPPLIGLSADDDVNGAPFYVMEHVDGVIARDPATAEQLSVDHRMTASRDLIDVMARLHAIEPASVGLDDLAKKDDYIARQLRRWLGQFEKSKTRELPLMHEVHDRLAASIPDQDGAGIVHGDYRLDNCIIGTDGTVAAVLDWELCTLGEVRADLGLLLVYWTEPGDELTALDNAPTTVPGFATRAQLTEWYADATGVDLADLDYFVAFSYWRLACILEGVYSRYLADVMGDRPEGFEAFGDGVVNLVEAAHHTLGADR
ncbi:MAG: phosphotransferase family protein [Acidimicrobiia bacterium]|nr:phosphotransferase family protein [Acidimicrobiia bacterium]